MTPGTRSHRPGPIPAPPWRLVARIPRRHVGVAAGVAIILLALASSVSSKSPSEILAWLQEVFGWAFAVPYIVLMALGAYATVQIIEDPGSGFAHELGRQTASVVQTLALTFTLLGISLGIGSLTGEALTPDNVQEVIADLTAHFSLAFMTTVVGLPSAALLRAAVELAAARGRKSMATASPIQPAGWRNGSQP